MTLTSALCRRVTISHHIGRTVDELAAVRWANGTAPVTLADRLVLIRERASDLDPAASTAELADELIGLAADVHAVLEQVELTVDHVVPVSLGGGDDPGNLVAACRDCNAGKASSSPDSALVDEVAGDALRWARAMKIAAGLQATRVHERERYTAAFADHWNTWEAGGRPIAMPQGWEDAIARFFDSDVEFDTLRDCVNIAMRGRVSVDRVFRYFCGVANNKLRERQEMAPDLITAGSA